MGCNAKIAFLTSENRQLPLPRDRNTIGKLGNVNAFPFASLSVLDLVETMVAVYLAQNMLKTVINSW